LPALVLRQRAFNLNRVNDAAPDLTHVPLTARNRALLASLFEPGAYGRGCVNNVADGARIRLIGDTIWSGTFRNRHEWGSAVFFALPRELAGNLHLRLDLLLVDGDSACALARGQSRLKNGRRYDNDYCLCYRLAAGTIVELHEFLDTACVTAAFGRRDERDAPPRSPGVMERQPAVRPATYLSSTVTADDPQACRNRALVQQLFEASPAQFDEHLLSLLATDVVYRLAGNTPVSGVHRGRLAVRDRLLAPLHSALDGPVARIADHLGTAGEWLWVQARGLARMRSGARYDNDYCYCLRLVDGQIREVIEYLDTELLARALKADVAD